MPDLRTCDENARAVFLYGKNRLGQGESLGQVEYEVIALHGVSRFVFEQARSALEEVSYAEQLKRTSYVAWMKKTAADLDYAGASGVILAAALIPASLWISYRIASLLHIHQSMTGLAPVLAVASLPIAWILGWPIYWLSRWYRIWRVSRIGDGSCLEIAEAARHDF